MKTPAIIVTLTLGLLSMRATAAPLSEAAARKALAPRYAQMRKAFLDRNIEGFMALFAPPGTAKPGEKVADAQKVRVQVGMNLAMVKKMTAVKMSIAKLAVKGDRIVVQNAYTYQGLIQTQPGKMVKLADSGMTRDTWARTPKGWFLLDIETLKSNPTLDGKPMKEYMKGAAGQSRLRK